MLPGLLYTLLPACASHGLLIVCVSALKPCLSFAQNSFVHSHPVWYMTPIDCHCLTIYYIPEGLCEDATAQISDDRGQEINERKF